MRARSYAANLGHGKYMARTYKAPKQAQYENQLMQLLADAAPAIPVDEAISLTVIAVLPVPSSWSKKKKDMAISGAIRPVGKPDLDNLVKNIKDCMTNLSFWKDDSRVCTIHANKIYGVKPCWKISMLWGNELTMDDFK